MRSIQLNESGPGVDVPLDRDELEALRQSEVVNVGYTGDPAVWSLSAGKYVGVVRVGDLQVTIKPKVDINRIVFMMGYSRDPIGWKDRNVRLDQDRGLPEALAETFRRLATRALDQGLLKGYVTLDDTTTVLRGRVRVADQLRKRFGRMVPLEVTYDEYTVDIAENRLLLATTLRLLRLPQVTGRERHGLQRLRLQLADVTSPPAGTLRPAWRPSRLNARYVPALELAEIILDGNSFEQRVGDVRVSGFLLNMAKIFEDFVCVALRQALAPLDGRSDLQFRTWLDREDRVPMRPDFVWADPFGRPALVVDAKYKAEKNARFPNADLYQLLAYCTVLGLPDGHLIYAQGEEVPQVNQVRGTDVRIHCHTLDLDAAPEALVESINRLARGLLQPHEASSRTAVGSSPAFGSRETI